MNSIIDQQIQDRELSHILPEVSDCCGYEMIPPDLEAAENAGSLYRSFCCYICAKCGKVCEPMKLFKDHGQETN